MYFTGQILFHNTTDMLNEQIISNAHLEQKEKFIRERTTTYLSLDSEWINDTSCDCQYLKGPFQPFT